MATFTSHSLEETIAFAREWARTLQPNDVVGLRGDLGAGKTHFVKGLVTGCGSTDPVTSPTFTILHEYRGGRVPVFHFDFYRLKDRAEAEALDLEDYLNEGGVAVIEWADRFPEVLPPRTRWVELVASGANQRTIVGAGGVGPGR